MVMRASDAAVVENSKSGARSELTKAEYGVGRCI